MAISSNYTAAAAQVPVIDSNAYYRNSIAQNDSINFQQQGISPQQYANAPQQEKKGSFIGKALVAIGLGIAGVAAHKTNITRKAFKAAEKAGVKAEFKLGETFGKNCKFWEKGWFKSSDDIVTKLKANPERYTVVDDAAKIYKDTKSGKVFNVVGGQRNRISAEANVVERGKVINEIRKTKAAEEAAGKAGEATSKAGEATGSKITEHEKLMHSKNITQEQKTIYNEYKTILKDKRAAIEELNIAKTAETPDKKLIKTLEKKVKTLSKEKLAYQKQYQTDLKAVYSEQSNIATKTKTRAANAEANKLKQQQQEQVTAHKETLKKLNKDLKNETSPRHKLQIKTEIKQVEAEINKLVKP